MDSYSKLDHETLVRNMNAVCAGLGRAMDRQRFGGPPALTYNDLADAIPLALYRIAVAAGWIEEQIEMEEDEYHRSKDADLFGGCMWLRASYQEWFLGLVADTITSLEATAESNLPIQNKYERTMQEHWFASHPSEQPQDHGKQKIDEYRKKVTRPRLHSFDAIAKSATEKSKAAGDNIVVTRISVGRIYRDEPKVGFDVRQALANFINEKVPCTAEDLLPSKTPPSRRSTPRDTARSTKK
jgi:hypothetical protein